jgi:hypothetical protein
MHHFLTAAVMVVWAAFCIVVWRRHRRLSGTITELGRRADGQDEKLLDAQIRINEAHGILECMLDTRSGEPKPLRQATDALNVTYIHAPRHRRREGAHRLPLER